MLFIELAHTYPVPQMNNLFFITENELSDVV